MERTKKLEQKSYRWLRTACWIAFISLPLLSFWELSAEHSPRAAFLFGQPTQIGTQFWSLLQTGELLSNFLITGGEAGMGILVGTVGGCALGLGLWLSVKAARAVTPFVFAISNVPVFAFAPLMIIWFGTDFGMKVALATFCTFFVSFGLAYRGASLAGGEALELLSAMQASRLEMLLKVVVPASLDSVFSSARLNIGFGLLGAFVGEFISSDKGLGYMIIRASGLYNTSRVFAICIGILLLAIIFNWIAAWLEHRRSRIVQMISVPYCLWGPPFQRR